MLRRVEIAPHYDLWMRGARHGTVQQTYKDREGRWIAVVKMDHPQVKNIQRFLLDDLKEV